MYPLLCANNTHHQDIKNFGADGMVRDTKHCISQEWNINFL